MNSNSQNNRRDEPQHLQSMTVSIHDLSNMVSTPTSALSPTADTDMPGESNGVRQLDRSALCPVRSTTRSR